MTRHELNRVRELKAAITRQQRKLEANRNVVLNLTSKIDGLPRTKTRVSHVEKMAIKIVEQEMQIAKMRGEMTVSAAELISAIRSGGLEEKEEQVLILRYVACLPFKDILDKLLLNERHIYKLHSRGVKKLLRK